MTKRYDSFIPSICPLKAEAVIGAGEEDCKCYQKENSEQFKMSGTGKEVEIPCVLLPLKHEWKTEGGLCLAEA